MNQTPPEVILANFVFIGFWLVTVLAIMLAGRFVSAMGRLRQRMLSHWKPALLITAVFIFSMGLGGSGWLNPYAIAIFCQTMIGLAIASSIPGFNSLPVGQAIKDRRNIILQIALLLGIALLAAFPALIIGSIGLSIGRQIFGETYNAQQAASTFFPLISGWCFSPSWEEPGSLKRPLTAWYAYP